MTDGQGDAPRATVDTLVVNGTVVTVDGRDTVLPRGAVAVDGGTIVGVGPTAALQEQFEARRIIDARGGFVLPGFVNTHAHLAMTMFRGFADDLDLQSFLARMFPAEARVLSDDSVATGVSIAVAESVLAGITSTLDMFFFPEAATRVAAEAGFRLHNGPVFVGFPGPDHRGFDERIAWADAFLAATGANPSAPRWIFPHGTYTLDLDQLRAVRDLGARHACRVHIHASENLSEVDTVAARYGRRPVELLGDLGLLGPSTVLAHAVELTDDEIGLLAATGTAVAHCPLSNLKLASGFARVPELFAAGVTVGLGTDGAASSNDLDPFAAMRFAATIHKARTGDASVLPAASVLRLATMGGARALGIDALVGSIEVGKRADVIVIDADAPHLVPSFDAASTLVYAAGRGDVRSVLVDGRVLVEDRQCTTIDVPAAVAAMRRLGARVASA